MVCLLVVRGLLVPAKKNSSGEKKKSSINLKIKAVFGVTDGVMDVSGNLYSYGKVKMT